MKSALHLISCTCLVGMLTNSSTLAQAEDIQLIPKAIPITEKETDQETDDTTEQTSFAARVHLTNGDKLRGTPQSVDPENNLHFASESLGQSATFPLKNILSLELGKWLPRERPDTLAHVSLFPRFRETKGDTILGSLTELTPESIKLETWYGGVITLKRSMVQSLRIINNSPGSYFGPNNIKEWTLTEGKGTWLFHNGVLSSRTKGGVGKDIGLRDKTHVSFDAKWEKSMRFRIQLYSNDVSDDTPDAYYDINFNRNYAFLRTHGKMAKGAQRMGGGRWQQIRLLPEENHARFDIYANRKAGTFNIYINGVSACLLQSLAPNPENLGTGMTFVAEERYPVKISGITVTPWNGTTLPNQTKNIEDELKKENPEEPDEETPEDDQSPPHKIILNNGDEIPGTVGKVKDDRMIIDTEFTPIRIPIQRIKSLSLGDNGEEPKKYSGDVRAWFHQGGYITLKLKSLSEGKLSGYSQAFGDITLELSAFARIDFHIYDKKANELRAEIR